MKNLFTLGAIGAILMASSMTASAQCEAPVCDTTLTIPVTVDQRNWFNNHAPANKCIEDNGTFGTELNTNGWSFLSIKSIGSNSINYLQTINYSSLGTDVYSYGNNRFSQVNFVGGSHFWASGEVGDTCKLPYITANNYSLTNPNEIHIDENIVLMVHGVQKFVGDTISTADNPSNKVVVVACPSTPLPLVITEFNANKLGLNNIQLEWIVTDVNEGNETVLQHSTDSKNWKTIYTTGIGKDGYIYASQSNMNYFRIKSGNQYSTIKLVQLDNTNSNVNVYPNPTTDFIKVEQPITKMTLTDISGKVIMTTNTQVIDMRNVANGIYYIRIEAGNAVNTSKVVKM